MEKLGFHRGAMLSHRDRGFHVSKPSDNLVAAIHAAVTFAARDANDFLRPIERDSLDPCDREVMSYVATTAAITGNMIRDLMAESVERRFGAKALHTPQPVEWLWDNGPPYTPDETRDLGEKIGLLVCTTPAHSPESNGMAASFVTTFTRDYVNLNELLTATSVMQQLARWFEDYNEVHPQKGLRMQSPREDRRAPPTPKWSGSTGGNSTSAPPFTDTLVIHLSHWKISRKRRSC